MIPSDAEILQLFRTSGQEEKAFNLIIRKYQQKVYWMIRRMVIDHDEADELTQEVFIKIWQKSNQFRGESELFTWIYRIAANHAISYLNSKKRRGWLKLEDVSAELINKIDNNHYFEGDETEKKLQKAICQLPDKQRLVFNMKYFEEQTYEEIAAVTGTSVGALKASYFHAVRKIEQYFENEN